MPETSAVEAVPGRFRAGWAGWAEDELAGIAAAGRLRAVIDVDGPPAATFASNDYLGLSQHPAVRRAAHDALDAHGAGAGAARLTVGSRPIHSELESEIAAWKGTEAALTFPTGYMANLGALGALGASARPGRLRIVSDALNHASIVDGCRLSGAEVEVYRHGDADHVEHLLSTSTPGPGPTVVVTETVFSMDGDIAPVEALAEACGRHQALLVLDEAHAVLGPHPDLDGVECLRVGTLSKALGSAGGFVAGPRTLVDLLVNRARPFVFTTAAPPASAAAALAALRIVRSPEGDDLVSRLRTLVDRVAPGHPSAVIPVIIGDDHEAVAISAALGERGIVVPAIRPPTVPPGTARLRMTLSAAHTDAQVDLLLHAMAAVGHPLG